MRLSFAGFLCTLRCNLSRTKRLEPFPITVSLSLSWFHFLWTAVYPPLPIQCPFSFQRRQMSQQEPSECTCTTSSFRTLVYVRRVKVLISKAFPHGHAGPLIGVGSTPPCSSVLVFPDPSAAPLSNFPATASTSLALSLRILLPLWLPKLFISPEHLRPQGDGRHVSCYPLLPNPFFFPLLHLKPPLL